MVYLTKIEGPVGQRKESGGGKSKVIELLEKEEGSRG